MEPKQPKGSHAVCNLQDAMTRTGNWEVECRDDLDKPQAALDQYGMILKYPSEHAFKESITDLILES